MVPERVSYSVSEPRVDRSRKKKAHCQSKVCPRSEEQDEHLEGLWGDIAEAMVAVPDEAIEERGELLNAIRAEHQPADHYNGQCVNMGKPGWQPVREAAGYSLENEEHPVVEPPEEEHPVCAVPETAEGEDNEEV